MMHCKCPPKHVASREWKWGGTRGLTPASMALALLKIAIYSLGGMFSFSDQMDQPK